MVVGLFGPTIDVGPLGALAIWVLLALAAVAILGSVTIGGAIAFILIGLVAVFVFFFGTKRIKFWLEGRR
jgi:uncharacterized membrane protein YuzA (DUF378 family)